MCSCSGILESLEAQFVFIQSRVTFPVSNGSELADCNASYEFRA
jgi:hypothetical protein